MQALRTGELCPAGWRPGQPTLTGRDEYLAKAFPELPEDVLAETAERSKRITVAPGEVVFHQGDAPDGFYVVANGEAEVVRRRSDDTEIMLSTLGPGEFFGEIGLLTEARRTASVRAKTELVLLSLDWNAFREMVEASEPTARDLAEIVRERLAATR
ncbi:MAG: cyclic nucleotide-binding domain-containing protein [Actinomycetota bacterium]